MGLANKIHGNSKKFFMELFFLDIEGFPGNSNDFFPDIQGIAAWTFKRIFH